MKELLNLQSTEAEIQEESDDAIIVGGGCLPYSGNVACLFRDGVDVQRHKTWYMNDDEVVEIATLKADGKEYLVTYQITEPEYCDEDYDCSGTLSVTLIKDKWDVTKAIRKWDCAKLNECVEALVNAVATSSADAAGYTAQALADRAGKCDVVGKVGTALADNPERVFRNRLLQHTQERGKPIDCAEAAHTLMEILKRHQDIEAFSVSMSIESEHDDQGEYMHVPSYYVTSVEPSDGAYEDVVLDELQDGCLVYSFMSKPTEGEVTLRVERKPLEKLLASDKASGIKAWKIIQATTKKWEKANKTKAA